MLVESFYSLSTGTCLIRCNQNYTFEGIILIFLYLFLFYIFYYIFFYKVEINGDKFKPGKYILQIFLMKNIPMCTCVCVCEHAFPIVRERLNFMNPKVGVFTARMWLYW